MVSRAGRGPAEVDFEIVLPAAAGVGRRGGRRSWSAKAIGRHDRERER